MEMSGFASCCFFRLDCSFGENFDNLKSQEETGYSDGLVFNM